MIPETETSQLQ